MHKNVFIDTSIYIQQNFNFEHNLFEDLIHLIDSGYISLYSTEITHFEIISNIEKRAEDVRAHVKSLTKKGGVFRHTSPFKSVFEKNILDIALNEIKESYRIFTKEAAVENIPVNTVDINMIFNKYFTHQPPFSKKKKTEFPDAFVLEALKKWCSSNKQKIIISKDNDMRDFCNKNEDLTLVDSLAELLDKFTSNDQLKKYNHVYNVYVQNKKAIEEYVMFNILENHNIEIADTYAYLEGISPEEIKVIGEVLVSRIYEKKAYLNFTIYFSYKAWLSTLDESNSIYDSETKGWLIEEYKNDSIENSLEIPIGLEIDDIDFEDTQSYGLSISNIDINNNQPIFIHINK